MATTAEIAIPKSAEDISPSWVQLVLQKDLPGIIITDVDVKGSINQGEGFMSDIIAFDAVGTRNGTSQRYSLVAKLTDFKRPFTIVKDWPKDFHIKIELIEVKFYSEAVPELLSVAIPGTERESKPGKEGQTPTDSLFLPKCYFAANDQDSKVSVRVMENLKSQGFSIKPNRQPLSRAEMMLVSGALAQLHGLSHLLELRSGKPLPEKYDWILSRSDMEGMRGSISYQYQTGVKEFSTAFPDQADLMTRLEKIDPYREILNLAVGPSSRLKVLCHAHCWGNNIMIEYDGDMATCVKLVDWQVPLYLPPIYDLAFLFLCNTSWDVFHNHRDDILAHYHHILQETLGPEESSGLRNYTLEQLKADFKADCLHGVIQRLARLVVLPADPDLVRMIQEIQKWESSGLRNYTLEQLKADFKVDCLHGVIQRLLRLVVLPADPDLVRMIQEIQEWGVI
uniref:CHK kinase-like domain-containing protein n=1 Tax=Branchiostoma floridae TaxID=7739 RepID=C3ZG16_BRAFL|eukprot:XP_002592480.1 hypothetical protein BRAFLDRAFT_68966 [Branchiostoma floridae]